jgi:putative ABC transport system permease protein
MARLFRTALIQAARLVATALAVALAVSLVSGTFMLTDTISAASRLQPWAKSSGYLPSALWLLAGVALIVGALLVWNTFSILVAQRTGELGLLRALGASRGQLRRLVLAEAMAIGLCASVAGVLIGFGCAQGLLVLGRVVGLAMPGLSVVVRVRSVVAGLGGGVTLTTVAALLPARRATQVSPVSAMTGRAARTRGLGRRAIAGFVAMVAGATVLTAGTWGGPATLFTTAIGASVTLIGTALLVPVAAGPAAWVIGTLLVRFLGEPAAVARQNVMRNPRRTAATAAALMIAIGLVGVVAIVGASMRASAKTTVQRTLEADIVVTPTSTGAPAPGTSAGVPPDVVQRLGRTPGVSLISAIGAGQWNLAGQDEALLAVDPATVTQMHQVDAASRAAVGRLDGAGVLVRDTVARSHEWSVGDVIPMTFERTGTRRLVLRGTYSTTVVPSDYVISLAALTANYTQPLLLEIDVKFAAGTAPATVEANARRAVADWPTLKVRDRSQVTAGAQAGVDKILTPLVALLGLSVLIGLLGIANALGLSIHERTAEIGMLRSVGMGRSQLRTMIRCEAVMISGIGSLVGAGLALGFGWVSVGALHHLGLTRMVVPFRQLGLFVAVVTGVGLLAAILPARRAAHLGILDAVHRAR